MGSLCQSLKPAYPSNYFEWASNHASQEGGGSNRVSNEVPNNCDIIEMMRYSILLQVVLAMLGSMEGTLVEAFVRSWLPRRAHLSTIH